MNVLVLQALDPIQVENVSRKDDRRLMQTVTGESQWFALQTVINFELQIQSLAKAGVNVRTFAVTNRKSPQALLRTALRIREIVRQENIELVHALWGSSTSLVASLASSVPVVISFCGSDLLGNYNRHGRKTFEGSVSALLSQVSAVFARRLIVMSENLRQALWSLSRSKASVVPAGIDLSCFFPVPQPEAREFLSWDLDEKIVLFFTGLGAHVKNRPLAEKIMELLRRQMPKVRLEVMEGVPHHKLNHYYNAADAMLLTSRHEGSNNSLKEAMACNLPIVATNCGDTLERLREVRPSYVVDSFDPEEIADKLHSVLQQGKRSNGRSFVNEVAMPNIAERIVDVYKAALQRSVSDT